MASFDRFDIVEAHCVLEWDYNKGGWLPERPTNRRRMQATSVQLHRMNFRARPTLTFEALSDNAKTIYLEKVLAWKLPRDAHQNRLIREVFSPDWLKANYPLVHSELHAQLH